MSYIHMCTSIIEYFSIIYSDFLTSSFAPDSSSVSSIPDSYLVSFAISSNFSLVTHKVKSTRGDSSSVALILVPPLTDIGWLVVLKFVFKVS